MFTIRHETHLNGDTAFYAAERINYVPEDDHQAALFLHTGKHCTVVSNGIVYVMNANGSTVGKFDLRHVADKPSRLPPNCGLPAADRGVAIEMPALA